MSTLLAIHIADRETHVAECARRSRRWEVTADRTYKIAAPRLPRTAGDVEAYGRELCRLLVADGVGPTPARVVVPPAWCLTQVVESPLRRWNEEAAILDAEQFLPVDLESLTCVGVYTGDRYGVVVGAFTEAIEWFLEALAEAGIDVESVRPAIDDVPERSGSPNGTRGYGTAAIDDGSLALRVAVSADDAAPLVRTMLLPDSNQAEHIARAIEQSAACAAVWPQAWEVRVFADEANADAVTQALEGRGCKVTRHDAPAVIRRSIERAANVASPMELRRNRLSHAGRWRATVSRLTRCSVVTAVLLLILGLRLRLDNLRHVQAITELGPTRDAIYAEVFPGQAVTSGAALRVESERIKLQGLTSNKQEGDAFAAPRPLEVFELLQSVTAAAPEQLKLFVNELVVDDQGLRLIGQTTSHSAAGDLVQALNRVPSIDVEPPRTKLRNDRTVDFHIHAARVSRDDGT